MRRPQRYPGNVAFSKRIDLTEERLHQKRYSPLMPFRVRRLVLVLGSLVGCAAPLATQPPKAGPTIETSRQLVSVRAAGTDRSLLEEGEQALREGSFEKARDAFQTLVDANPRVDANLRTQGLLGLATALEGLGENKLARDRLVSLATEYPHLPTKRFALLRLLRLQVALEDWKALGDTAEQFLARPDIDPVDRIAGLGARGLSKIEAGDDIAAMRDVQNALDLVDEHAYGKTGRLPPAAAQVQFALGEVRRVRSERIRFVPEGPVPDRLPVSSDFLRKLDARCTLLLDAQRAYADAMRANDAHWIAMSGTRVGEMYRTLHRDILLIPPTPQVKSEKDEKLFFAIMHVRFRVLLEKGLDMIDRTLVIRDMKLDASSWITRAEALKKELESAIAVEKETLKTFPYSEEVIVKTIELLRKKADAQAEREQEALFKNKKTP